MMAFAAFFRYVAVRGRGMNPPPTVLASRSDALGPVAERRRMVAVGVNPRLRLEEA
jgi:hypothetical protein